MQSSTRSRRHPGLKLKLNTAAGASTPSNSLTMPAAAAAAASIISPALATVGQLLTPEHMAGTGQPTSSSGGSAMDGRVTLRLSPTRSVEVASDQLHVLGVVGRGAYGVVERVLHRPSHLTMAVKRIPISCNSVETKRMLTDLDVSMRCMDCPHAVQFYGALFEEGHVCICMELMDCSVDQLYAAAGALKVQLPECLLARVAYSIVSALHYLYSRLRVIHRDVKPSNMLCNRAGRVKLCDFGIAGYLVDSVAKTIDAGCKPYMAPERIDPVGDQSYDIRSDVWSLGISLVELATGEFPYCCWRTPFEQLKQVVNEPPPRLTPAAAGGGEGGHSEQLCRLVERCLQKRCADRPSYTQLLADPFLAAAAADATPATPPTAAADATPATPPTAAADATPATSHTAAADATPATPHTAAGDATPSTAAADSLTAIALTTAAAADAAAASGGDVCNAAELTQSGSDAKHLASLLKQLIDYHEQQQQQP